MVKDRHNRYHIFIKYSIIFTLIYVLTVLVLGFVLEPSAAMYRQNNLIKLWNNGFPLLFAVLCLIFYVIKRKGMYILTALLLIGTLTDQMHRIQQISLFQISKIGYGVILIALVFAFPLLDRLVCNSKVFRIQYCMNGSVIAMLGEFAQIAKRSWGEPGIWEIYGGIIRFACICCLVVTTVVVERADGEVNEKELLARLILFQIAAQILMMVTSVCLEFEVRFVELLGIFFLLFVFLVDYIAPKTVRICYLILVWLMLIGKEILLWWAREVLSTYDEKYYITLSVTTVLLLITATVYTICMKDNPVPDVQYGEKKLTSAKRQKRIRSLVVTVFSFSNFLLICFMVWTLTLWAKGMIIRPGCVYIPYGKSTAFFKGTEEEFVQNYENPYMNERVYLDFEYLWASDDKKGFRRYCLLDPRTDDCLYIRRYHLDEEPDAYIIGVWGGGLEKVYYFLPIEKRELLTADELAEEDAREERKSRTIRVVLDSLNADEKEKDAIYFYKITLPQDDGYTYTVDSTYRSEYLYFDVQVGEKEIPAYMLYDVHYGDYTFMRRYYWNDNYYAPDSIRHARVY